MVGCSLRCRSSCKIAEVRDPHPSPTHRRVRKAEGGGDARLAVPVTASYIIAAVTVVRALTSLGVSEPAAHMFIF